MRRAFAAVSGLHAIFRGCTGPQLPPRSFGVDPVCRKGSGAPGRARPSHQTVCLAQLPSAVGHTLNLT